MSSRDPQSIIAAIRASANFVSELKYVARGGYEVAPEPRLFKFLDNDLVRVVFPTTVSEVGEGTIVAIVTLWDLTAGENIYAHTITAGPGVNILLRATGTPMPVAWPQPGKAGEKAIAQFVAWKQAAWTRFLNDELDLGTEAASRVWIANFWKALDRMFGGGTLVDYDPQAIVDQAQYA